MSATIIKINTPELLPNGKCYEAKTRSIIRFTGEYHGYGDTELLAVQSAANKALNKGNIIHLPEGYYLTGIVDDGIREVSTDFQPI